MGVRVVARRSAGVCQNCYQAVEKGTLHIVVVGVTKRSVIEHGPAGSITPGECLPTIENWLE